MGSLGGAAQRASGNGPPLRPGGPPSAVPWIAMTTGFGEGPRFSAACGTGSPGPVLKPSPPVVKYRRPRSRSIRLFEDQRTELSQELTPDEPVVCSGRSVERGVQTGFLRSRVKRLGPVQREIGGTGADPVMLYSAGIHPLQRVHVLLGVLAAGAPDCDPPEHPGIIVGRRGCMASAHRQAGDGTALFICDRPEILLDKRNYFLHEAMRVGPFVNLRTETAAATLRAAS